MVGAKQKAALLAAKITNEALKHAGKGLKTARIFLQARVKETLSVPAPRKKIPLAQGGGYRATKPAIPYAPPRKLSGKLRSGVSGRTVSPVEEEIIVKAHSNKGFDYARYHEVVGLGQGSGKHRYLKPTLDKWKGEVAMIAGWGIE
jgi:hypothetical protein